MTRLAPSVNGEKEMIKMFRARPKMAMSYLDEALKLSFEDNDPDLLLLALSTLARAYGMTRLAKKTSLKRESLHRMLSKKGNPEWKSLFKVLNAFQVRPRLEIRHLRS